MKNISRYMIAKSKLMTGLCAQFLLIGFYSSSVVADITVNGTGKVMVEPNLASFDITVETKNPEAQVASTENAKLTGKIVKELKKLIKEKDAVTTEGYAIYQDYEYDNKAQTNKVVGFKTVNQVHIKTTDLAKLGNLLDMVVAMGVTAINNLQFSYENQEIILHQALARAVSNATERAKILASAGGLSLDGIISIDSTLSNYSAPRPVNNRMMLAMKAAPVTPVEPGSVNIEASVNVIFKTKKA